MDPIQPVGAMIQPPNPNQGLNAYSTLLGIQQQKQQLQIGQAQLPGIQAQSQQQVQTATQRSALANYFQTHDMDKHVGADGTLDLNVLSDPDLRRAAGDSFPQVAQSLLTVKNSQLEAKTRFANLNDTLRTQFDRSISALREDDDVKQDNEAGRRKVQTAIDQFAGSGGPDAQRIAQIYSPMLQHVPQGKLSSALGNVQMQAQSATEQQAQQNPVLGTQFGPSGNLVGVAQNRATAALSSPEQQGVQVGLGPMQTPSYEAAVRAAGQYGAGAANSDVERANQVGALARNANWTIDLSKRVDQLATMINSGDIAAKFSGGAKYLGFSSVAQIRTELVKDLGLLKGPISAQAGSDERAQTILEGYPTDTTPEGTIHSSMDQIRGRARQDLARNQLLAQYKTRNPQDLQGYQAADNALMTHTSPLMHEFSSLKPEERGAFYRRNFKTPQEAQQFKDSIKASQNAVGP